MEELAILGVLPRANGNISIAHPAREVDSRVASASVGPSVSGHLVASRPLSASPDATTVPRQRKLKENDPGELTRAGPILIMVGC